MITCYHTCVCKLLSDWRWAALQLGQDKAYSNSSELHFNVWNNSLIYRSHCDLDRSTRRHFQFKVWNTADYYMFHYVYTDVHKAANSGTASRC